MLDHRMAGKADRAGDLHAFIARRDGGKGDAGIHDVALDAVEAPEKIEMPPRAAEFAVGDRLQAGRFLLADDGLDLAIFDRLERCGIDLALGVTLARLFQRGRTQQAADMIGAERRFGSLTHCFTPVACQRPQTSSASSTIMRSFAHSSSSARTLPSSVEAKPHCGDRQS